MQGRASGHVVEDAERASLRKDGDTSVMLFPGQSCATCC